MPGWAVGALGVIQGKTPLHGKYNSAQQFSGKGFLQFFVSGTNAHSTGSLLSTLYAFVECPSVSKTCIILELFWTHFIHFPPSL